MSRPTKARINKKPPRKKVANKSTNLKWWQQKIDIKLVVFVIVFAVVGTYFLVRSMADSSTSYKLADKAIDLTTATNGPKVVTESQGSKRNAKVVYVATANDKVNSVKLIHNADSAGEYSVCSFGRSITGGTAKLKVSANNQTTTSGIYPTGSDYQMKCINYILYSPGNLNISSEVTNGAWQFSSVGVKLIKKLASQLPSAGTYPTTGKDAFGIAMDGTRLLENMTSSERSKNLNNLQDLGVKWYRQGFLWNVIQPSSTSSYNWSKTDLMVSELNTRGIKVMGLIAYVPNWARESGCHGFCPPADNAKFASFAKAVVQRYKSKGVRHWEIWNEPNTSRFWSPKPNVAEYTALLKQTAAAIKSVDPEATIITGGTAPAATDGYNISPIDFAKGIYANGGKNSFDALGHHPYCFYPGFNCPDTFKDWSAWSQMHQTNPSLRSIMVSNGDSAKKIWATEFGSPTGGDPQRQKMSDSEQAEMATDAYALFTSYDWAGPMFWFTLNDISNPPYSPNDMEWWFGLVRGDGSKKPSYSSYKNAAGATH